MFLGLVIFIYILVALALIAIVLVQPGKGFGAESAQGSGYSGTVFGSSGPLAAFRRFTIGLAVIFLSLTLILGGLLSRNQVTQMSALEEGEELQQKLEVEQLDSVSSPLKPLDEVSTEEPVPVSDPDAVVPESEEVKPKAVRGKKEKSSKEGSSETGKKP